MQRRIARHMGILKLSMLHQWGEMVTVEQNSSGSCLIAKVLIDIVTPLALTVTKE
jgi:hypothetical protein